MAHDRKEKTKMANDKMIQWIVIGVLVWFAFGQGGQQAPTTVVTTSSGTIPGGCAIEPTFELQASDKWDTSINIGVGHRYILDGGQPTTYTTATTATMGDSLKVLWGYANRSDGATIYHTDIGNYKITKCGKNIFVNNEMIANTTMTVQCFNEENQLIDDSTQNETINAGETADLKCEIIGGSEVGMPHGGMLTLDFNSTNVYDKSKIKLTGDIVLGKTTDIANVTVSSTSNSLLAWEVGPIVDTGRRYLDLHIEVKTSSTDPAGTGDPLTLRLYEKSCFENTETHDFECGIADEDGNLVHAQIVGTEVINVD